MAQAQALVAAFYQRFHGLSQVTAHPKELAHALALLTAHGEAKASFLLTYAQQEVSTTAYQPRFFGGILPYLPQALAAYEARSAQATRVQTRQAAARERRRHERYLTWQQEQCAQLRAALPCTELGTLEATQRTRLVTAGTPVWTLGLAVCVAVDATLEAQAGLPACDTWRQTQEAA